MNNEYKIISLKENPNLIDEACKFFSNAWQIPYNAYYESMEEMKTSSLGYPFWLVVTFKDEIVGGLGVIKNDFHSRIDLFPNICAVFVKENHRRKGLCPLLLKTIIEHLHKHKIDKVYLVTNHTSLYEKYGFAYYCETMCEDGPSRVYLHEYKK